MARQTAAIGAQSLFTIVNAPRWANGKQGAALRARQRRRLRPVLRRRRLALLGHVHAAGRARCRCRRSRTSPSGTSPTAASTCCRRAATARRPRARSRGLVRACADAVHAVSPDARVAAGPIASRGAQGGASPIAFLDAYRQAGGPRPQALALQPVHERPRAGLQAQGDARRRRHHAAQPRPARALAEQGLRRQRADLVHRVRLAHRADAEARHHLARQAGRPPAQDGHARAHALPVREAARLVPRARRVAHELLALGPGHVRLAAEARLRAVQGARGHLESL